ncbi:hypothetical protein ACGFIF_17175 [Kribbella sp. NPDC049174]|uniref:hypothetical protein n=1 Tax=Kribbella sp. NPDC049174 TaxID=3364112 RepID=UPI00371E11D7
MDAGHLKAGASPEVAEALTSDIFHGIPSGCNAEILRYLEQSLRQLPNASSRAGNRDDEAIANLVVRSGPTTNWTTNLVDGPGAAALNTGPEAPDPTHGQMPLLALRQGNRA